VAFEKAVADEPREQIFVLHGAISEYGGLFCGLYTGIRKLRILVRERGSYMAEYSFIHVTQGAQPFSLTVMPASHVVAISYAAVRRRDEEEGAVQRLLNPTRIGAIKAFTLAGGAYPASIVLNWTGDRLIRTASKVQIPDVPRSAQIIDGQHRVAGIKAAIEENPELGTLPLPVAIYENLSTRECANIFLSINTEQRPVPRSLVYDLYGVTDDELVDLGATRAKDIALALNEVGQPYEDLIKLPNSPRQRGGIQLSTVVSAVKPMVEEKGTLEQVGVSTLEQQEAVFKNFFGVLRKKYGEAWPEKENAFIYASGFTGAIDFLQTKLVPYCVSIGSFSADTIAEALRLEPTNLILQSEVKGLGGKDAPRKVVERLVDVFEPRPETIKELKF
jgi:DNA sulfur modification protein DndB